MTLISVANPSKQVILNSYWPNPWIIEGKLYRAGNSYISETIGTSQLWGWKNQDSGKKQFHLKKNGQWLKVPSINRIDLKDTTRLQSIVSGFQVLTSYVMNEEKIQYNVRTCKNYSWLLGFLGDASTCLTSEKYMCTPKTTVIGHPKEQWQMKCNIVRYLIEHHQISPTWWCVGDLFISCPVCWFHLVKLMLFYHSKWLLDITPPKYLNTIIIH